MEYDSTRLRSISPSVQLGAQAGGLVISQTNRALPFLPVHPQANRNFLVQLSGGGTQSIKGDSLEIVKLRWQVQGSYGDSIALWLDGTSGRAFLTTINAADIVTPNLRLNDGAVLVRDLTPPAPFDLVAPPDGAWEKNRRPVLQWSASSDAQTGLARYQLLINTAVNQPQIAPTLTSIQPASDLNDGVHRWQVVAVDHGNNYQPSNQTRELRIDATPPASVITFPATGGKVTSANVTITGTATDGAGIGVDKVEVSTDGGLSWQPAANSGVDFSTWSYVWSGLTNGNFMLKSRAADKLGNTETPGAGVTVVVDRTAVASKKLAVPLEFALGQNYPNPFNPETFIEFALPQSSHVTIRIFNLVGEEIRKLVDETLAPGYHQVTWDGKDGAGHLMPTGVYLYKMQAANFVAVKKSVMVR